MSTVVPAGVCLLHGSFPGILCPTCSTAVAPVLTIPAPPFVVEDLTFPPLPVAIVPDMDDNVRIPLSVVSDALNEAEAFLFKAREAYVRGRFVEGEAWIAAATESLGETEDAVSHLAFEERRVVVAYD